MSEKEERIIAARNGDHSAFQYLIENEQDALYRFAYIYVRNEADAIEIFTFYFRRVVILSAAPRQNRKLP
ncbi:hypothetical protein JFL43_05010 [Viridibacillus sp. YIM B01967]|uniref:RNA polymerase sigma-70 region 2 domain-containing protein n=1 Tax=Viridibacillus soli TaxID=2798301 RepID=A0ABS1H476_9BACL|nr:hypothetical protein [Viridibacillus soli]MBK3494225.1 hypothetical protein [Viridibacillus soli]